ncbi:MAG: TRAP transporter large permease subunit [Candidatus Caldatribacteriota bacterium]|nr:TRAP transporter large permease subunit [Atribacterota bacterium]MDD4288072.1 TRAP transporter large permease subunit [Atribacterota bacterium]MDD4764669.1 TRAP transporter large permease subunit [Atribacterota bacterium]
MVGVFAVCSFKFKLPVGIGMAIAAISGSLVAGFGIPVRHLIEGGFNYLNTILVIATAMVFMKVVQYNGMMDTITRWLIEKYYSKPALLVIGLSFIVVFPGMITGSATAAVLTGGVLVSPVLIFMGFPKEVTAAVVAMAAVFGEAAPPINVNALIIGGGIDLPYIGFTMPLLIITVPLIIFTSLFIGRKYLKTFNYEKMKEKLPNSYLKEYGIWLFLPIIVLFALMLRETFFPQLFPTLGMPIYFLIAAIVGIFSGKKFNFSKISQEAVHDALPVLGILVGVGMFIQIMTLTGLRGYIVINCLSLPRYLLYSGIAVSMPLFGAVSAYGSASVLGVPFALALLESNPVITVSALSQLAALGDLMPPTALAGIFAAQVVGEKNYFKVLKYCIIPAIITAVWCIVIIMFANTLADILL